MHIILFSWELRQLLTAGTSKNGHKHTIHKLLYLRIAATLVLLLTLLTGNLTQAAAADWDTALDDINALHGKYTALQEVIKADGLKLQKLRKQNTTGLKSVNAALQAVDQTLLTHLKAEADTVRKKHAPLLEQYSTLAKQSAAAKKSKDLKTATLLDLKRNKLKAAAAAARSEVKTKTDALAIARKQTAAKTKPAKEALAPAVALRKQISAENKTLTAAQKARSEADKRYKAAVKQGNAVTAAAEMKASYAQMSTIHNLQQTLYDWEQKVSLALRSAEAKLPK